MECISSHISLEAFEDAPFSSCNPSIFQTLSGTFEVGTNGNLPISPEVGPKVGTNGNLPIFPEVGHPLSEMFDDMALLHLNCYVICVTAARELGRSVLLEEQDGEEVVGVVHPLNVWSTRAQWF
jgi:hypothetical protein